MKYFIIFSILMVACFAQRPTYVKRPVGFPEITTQADLSNRFGDGDSATERLPIEAYGDRDLLARLNKLPIDNQPFWFINWKHSEEQRKNPKSYPQRQNTFIDAANSGTPNEQIASQGQITTRNLGDSNNDLISQKTEDLDILNQMQQNQQKKQQTDFQQNYEVPNQNPQGRRFQKIRC